MSAKYQLSGETYSGGQPFFLGNDNASNNLHAAKTTAATGSLEILEHKGVDLGVVVHVVLVDAKVLGLLGEDRGVGHDNGNGAGLLGVGVDHDVGDGLSAAVDGLDLLEGNVFTTSHLDEVLDTVDDLEMAVLIKLTNITALKPAVFGNGLSSLLWVVEVLLHNGETTHPDLALGNLGVGVVANFGDGNELDLDGRGNGTDGKRRVLERAAESAVGTGLGETVADKHRAENEGKEVLGALGDAASTVHGETETATSESANLGKDNAVKDASKWQLISGHEGLVVEGTPEEALLDRAGALELGHDALLDSLPNLGDTDHDGRSELAHVTSAVLDRGVRECAGVAVANGSTNEHEQVLEGHFEDVGEGEVGENNFFVANAFVDAGEETSD